MVCHILKKCTNTDFQLAKKTKTSTAPTQPKHIDRLLYKSKQIQTYGIHLHANLNNYKNLLVN